MLVTGEAVALDLRPAALPSRLVAAAVDAVAQGVLLTALTLVLAAGGQAGLSSAAIAALTIVFLVLVVVGYPVAFETLWRGKTPGKAVMGLRVVRDDGGPVGFRQALVRGLAALFLERPGITLFTGAVVTSLLNRESKRLGDLLAGTLVLQERIPTSLVRPVEMPPVLADWAAELDLSGLSDDLALSVRSFMGRGGELTPAARDDLGAKLVTAVAEVVRPPAPEGTPGWAYLAAVLAERRRRAELRLAPADPAPVTASLEGTAAPVRAPQPSAPAAEPPPGGFALPF